MDEIIQEVRENREKLNAEYNWDLHALCESLRQQEQAHPARIVNRQNKGVKAGE